VFREGPIITNILLVDEINRATPRTQSALLEAMAEGQVSVEGNSRPLPNPFFLIATESPGDAEGTFPLPEVQKDRFFMTVSIGYPDREAERAVMGIGREASHPLTRIQPVAGLETLIGMQQQVLQVHVDESLCAYILALVGATRSDRRLALGVSPRGSLALYKAAQALAALRDRDYVTPEDIQEVAYPVLRKRIILKAEGQAQRVSESDFIAGIVDAIGVPPLSDALSG
jgi:MoxR-like ATPase